MSHNPFRRCSEAPMQRIQSVFRGCSSKHVRILKAAGVRKTGKFDQRTLCSATREELKEC